MDNGYSGVSNNDAATLALLSGGYGAIGASRGGFEYDGSVVNNNVNRNGADIAFQNQATRDQLNQHDVNRKMSQLLETSNNARMETLQQINDARAEAAKCCCETKLLVTTENNATRTLLLEQRIAQQENSANAAGQVAILQAINNLAASMSGHGRD